MPNKDWFWYQEWNEAIFLHYKVDVNKLREFIPNDLELEISDNYAWISLVAFTMNDLLLTERYCLYKNNVTQMKRLEIHHKPWELFQIQLNNLNIHYNQYDHLANFNQPDLCHYSPGVQVVAWT